MVVLPAPEGDDMTYIKPRRFKLSKKLSTSTLPALEYRHRSLKNKAMQNPKHIFITGASSGIGAALASHYAATGIRLSLTGRNEQRLSAIKDDCEAKGAVVDALVVDVTNREAMEDAIIKADQSQNIDLIIANAGISGGTGGVMNGEPIDQARAIFDVNLYGVLNTISPALDRMIKRGEGQVAIMSSLAGFRGWPSAPAYCGSKAAVKIYGESLRGAIAKTGVCVSVICPGFVKSAMTDANDFPMPFLVPTDKAAAIISKGLAKNKSRICFPFVPTFFSWLFATLPDGLVQIMLRKMPAKGAMD